MATRGESKFSCCSSCLDNGRNIAARHYCVECEMYFCTKCVDCHNTIPSLRKHQVNDVYSSDSTDADYDTTSLQSDVPSESAHSLRCTLHQGKPIDTFCKDHNEVCCGSCILVKHRLCATMPIAIAAKDFKSSPDVNKCKEVLIENLVQSKQEKEKRTENLESIGQQKLESIEDVDKYEEKIIARIKELANISRNEIRSTHEELKKSLDIDIEALDVVVVTNTECVDKLEQTDDDSQLFVLVKTSKTATTDGELLLQTMTKDWKKRGIKFCCDQMFEKQVFELATLGRLEVYDHTDTGFQEDCVVTEYQATFHSNIKVNQSHVSDTCIFDVCLMDNNDLLLTDNENNKLKRFNSNLEFTDEIVLSGAPCAVCKTVKHEVAVRIRNTKVVQFVSVGQPMQLTSSFTLANDGWGMTYDASTGEILACEENKVSVYSKAGNKQRTFDKDTNGEQLFSACRQIVLSMNRQDIYITDHNKGLIVLDKIGALKMKVALPGVSQTMPLCILPGHIILAGSENLSQIVQIDKHGKQVGNLIDTKVGRHRTYCAVYDREQSKLLVGGYPSVISVYTLSAKRN